jgi:hypothetical protein
MENRSPRTGERGSAVVIAMLLVVLLFLLGVALLATSETESAIAANDQWAEGAFQAADAAVQVSIDRLDVGSTDQTVEATALGEVFAYRSGGRDDTEAQPPNLVAELPEAGYAVGTTTGYNSSGYVFQVYEIQGTGTGPRNTEREVEVQVELGPVEP